LSRRLDEAGRPIPALGLRRIENGERRVDVDDLAALAFALGVNPNALLFPPVNSSFYGVSITGLRRPGTDAASMWQWANGERPILTQEMAEMLNEDDPESDPEDEWQRLLDRFTQDFRARIDPRPSWPTPLAAAENIRKTLAGLPKIDVEGIAKRAIEDTKGSPDAP
jgi:transcriptional regulator with XRE-family HTH domain